MSRETEKTEPNEAVPVGKKSLRELAFSEQNSRAELKSILAVLNTHGRHVRPSEDQDQGPPADLHPPGVRAFLAGAEGHEPAVERVPVLVTAGAGQAGGSVGQE